MYITKNKLVKSKNKNINNFLKDVHHTLNKYNFKLKIIPKKKVCRFDCDGYFDEHKKIIVIKKVPHWLEILVHEYAHFLQFINNHPTYVAFDKFKLDPMFVVENWLSNKKSKYFSLNKCFNTIRKNEIDCDKLSVKLIKKYKLPIDISGYIKDANLQIIFYHCVEKTRKWYPDKTFYSDKFIKKIPSKFNNLYHYKLPKKMLLESLKYFKGV